MENIFVFGSVILFIMWIILSSIKERNEWKSKEKHIQRTYKNMTFNIIIRPTRESVRGFGNLWECIYTSLDNSICDDFLFKDYPSIEAQMQAKIIPKVVALSQWQERLKEIENIS